MLKSFASTTLEALDGLAPEERHRIYKMMNLKTTALLDGGVSYLGSGQGGRPAGGRGDHKVSGLLWL